MIKECKKHGLTEHFLRKGTNSFRCKKCACESVIKRRRNKKEFLVKEFGGKCSICGYDKCISALQFHHLDPSQKDFTISSSNNVSYARMKKEAEKCILVCANCHAEIHFKTHRLQAYQKFGDEIYKKGIVVRHLDGNSLNNSYYNIEIGTDHDNMMDIPKEERAKRSSNANKKYSDEIVENIRHYRELGANYKEIMKKYNISSKGTLSYIINKR